MKPLDQIVAQKWKGWLNLQLAERGHEQKQGSCSCTEQAFASNFAQDTPRPCRLKKYLMSIIYKNLLNISTRSIGPAEYERVDLYTTLCR